MAAAFFAPNGAPARAPNHPTAQRPCPPPLPVRRPLISWRLVVPAVAGSFVLVVALFALVPHRRPAPAAPAGDVSPALLVAESAPKEVAPAPEPQASAPAPAPTPPEIDTTPVASLAEAVAAKAPVCQQYGTKVDFYDSPAAATRNALKEEKLLFVLHVAGNFEEPGFT
jgi:hypothetical protein